jgi:hypothetical protein
LRATVIKQATTETDTQIAGTALIALRDNLGQGDIDRERLARRAQLSTRRG